MGCLFSSNNDNNNNINDNNYDTGGTIDRSDSMYEIEGYGEGPHDHSTPRYYGN